MLRKILPHVSIVLSNMYIVFFLIDRVNSAMSFINNDLTKWLLVFSSLVSIVNAIFLIHDERRRVAFREKKRKQQLAAARAAQTASPKRRSV